MRLALVDLRLGRRWAVLQEIEVAAVVSLADVLLEHASVAPLVARGRRNPCGAAPRHFLVRYVQVKKALGDVNLDLVGRNVANQVSVMIAALAKFGDIV